MKRERMVYPEDKSKNLLSSMWEIRTPGTLKSKAIGNSNSDEDAVYLKHVMTGEFLYCEDGENLVLSNIHSKRNNSEGFLFFMKMKNNWTSDNSIKFNTLVTLKSKVNKNLINFYEKDNLKYEIKITNAQKNSFPFFRLESCGSEKRIALKIKDINRYIVEFYKKYGSVFKNETESYHISYKKCLEEEDLFEKKIGEISLCIKNLISIFTEDIILGSENNQDINNYANKSQLQFKNATLQKNQNYLLNNKILDNLYSLFLIIVQYSYFSLVNFKNNGEQQTNLNRLYFVVTSKTNDFYQLKLPQNFFRDYLERIIESTLKLFYLVSYNNSKTSAFFLKRFNVFYHLMYFYKSTILQFLKEITSNSDQLEGDHQNVLETLFEDLELPSFKKDFIDRHSNKLKFLKNVIKNMSKKISIENMNGIAQMVQNFCVSFDRNFYLQFDQNENEDFVCKFFIVKLINIRDETLRVKIKKIKRNLVMLCREHIEQIENENDNFDIIQITMEGLSQLEEFHEFFKYYIKLKSRLFNSNLNMGTMLLGLKSLEDDPSKQVLLKMSINPQLNNPMRSGVINFINKVYLFFKKYNFFINDYDFTYFCQKLGRVKATALFSRRPIELMNPEITNFSVEIFDNTNRRRFSIKTPLGIEEDFENSTPQNYIDISEINSFYMSLLGALEAVLLQLTIPMEVSAEEIERKIGLFKSVVSLLSLIRQFLDIGYSTFEEVGRILELLNKYVEIFTNKVMFYADKANADEQTLKISVTIFKKYLTIHSFLMEVSEILNKINSYRTNLIVSVIIKFFHTLSLRHNFSELTTNDLMDHFGVLMSIFNFEDELTAKEHFKRYSVSDFEKMAKFFKKMHDTGQTDSTNSIEALLMVIKESTTNLIQVTSPSLCSNMTKIMLIMINNGDLAYKQMKKVIDKSLLQFDELYYMKILRSEILQMVEDYYLRSIKVLSKLRNIQFIFDDNKLNEIMQLVEHDPEKIKVYNDNIQKKDRDIFMVIEESKHLISQIKKINEEMTSQYLSKIYFKKMQKMVQISKLPQICLVLMNKIYDHICQLHGSPDSSLQQGSARNISIEISVEVRALFFELKRFFVLQMIKSNRNVIGDCDKLKDKCIDVFIEYGFQCDDLIIELNQYLDEALIQEELENFFKYMEVSELFSHFDHINTHDLETITASSSSLNLTCQTIEQYFNILRHLTFYPDTEIKTSLQSQIINNILQTDLMKKIADKDFVNNFCFEVKKHIPSVQGKTFTFRRILRANTYTNQQTTYTLVITAVGKMFKNMLELVTNCMKDNIFSKLVYCSQIKYQEIFEILKLKRLPLFLKSHFYRILFESYYSTNRVPFKKIITLINKVLVQELELLNKYSQHHQKSVNKFPHLPTFSLGLKRRIAKRTIGSNDYFDDQGGEVFGEVFENGNEDNEDDDNSIEISDGSLQEEEEEEESGDDGEGDVNNHSRSKDFEVFNKETGGLDNIWFEPNELQNFLGEKLKNNTIDGFIPFIADLVSYMLFNVNNQKKLYKRTKSVLNDFYEKLQKFVVYFKFFEKKFDKEIFAHNELLLTVSLQNLYTIRHRSDILVENENKTHSTIKSYSMSRDTSLLSMNRHLGIGRVRRSPTPNKDNLNIIQEDDEFDNESNDVSAVMRDEAEMEKKAEDTINLIRYSLISLKMTFSEALKDLFEDELVDMEKKLIYNLEKIIEKAKLVKFNFFITLEVTTKIDISYEDIEKVIRFFFYRMKTDEEKEFHSIDEELQISLNEVETIALIINLNKALYKSEDQNNNKINMNRLARVESFTEIELASYLDAIENMQNMDFAKLENFLSNQSFYSMYLNLNEFHMLEVQKVHMGFNTYILLLQQLLFNEDLPSFQRIFRRKTIEKCLSNQKSRFFYIHSLKVTIQRELAQKKNRKRFKKKFYIEDLNGKQKLLNDKFVGYFCLKVLISKKSEGEIIMSECLDILYLMLVHGNEEVQEDLYRVIIRNYGDFNLVDFFETHINVNTKKIKDKLLNIQINYKNMREINNEHIVKKRFLSIDSYRLMVSILRFLQVLNENCFTRFQDLFREQKFYNQNTNNNLIQKIIDMIITFGEYVMLTDNSLPREGFLEDVESTEDSGTVTTLPSKKGIVFSEQKKKKRKIYQSQGFEKMMTTKKEDIRKRKKALKRSRVVILTYMESAKLKSLLHYALFYINDSMMGPNKKNQNIILNNPGLLDFAASIIREMRFPVMKAGLSNISQFNFNVSDYLLFSDAMQLFLYSTDIFDKSDQYKEVFKNENIELVKFKMSEIYNCIIVNNKKSFYSNSFCPELDKELTINESGFEDVNLSDKSSLLRQNILKDNLENTLFVPKDKADPNYKSNHLEVRKILAKVVIGGHNMFIFLQRSREFYSDTEKIKGEYYQFYNYFYGYVELKHNETIEILRYTKLYMTYFHYDSHQLSNEFAIEPHNEKINNFIDRIEKEEEKLSNRQFVYGHSTALYYMIKNKTIVEYLFYFILIIINAFIIYNAEHKFDGDLNVTELNLKRGVRFFDDNLHVSKVLLFLLGLLNLLFAILIFFFNFFEAMAETKFYWKLVHLEIMKERSAVKKKSKGLIRLYLGFLSFVSNTDYTGIGWWCNFYNFYNLIVVAVSMTSLFIPLLYTFLLLDIIQRSLTLRNIIRSVTNNWQQLILTTIVTLIIMYVYASVSFTFFPDQYGHTDDDDFMNYCHTLGQCFLSVINNGLRAGGGLGEALGQPTIEDTRYTLRYWVDLSFMIIILIILLNIVFGIIIDTFGDMRNARDEWSNYINNTCLLCDLTKSEIDSAGEGYYKHINVSHAVDDYVHFLIYIKNRNLNDCDGIEQKVKIKYENFDYTFLPNQESFYFKRNPDQE